MKENLKIFSAAVLGVSSPVVNRFFELTEPIMRLLLLSAQIGVAGATIVYIVAKIRKLRKAEKNVMQ